MSVWVSALASELKWRKALASVLALARRKALASELELPMALAPARETGKAVGWGIGWESAWELQAWAKVKELERGCRG